jgi:hypothetical protein
MIAATSAMIVATATSVTTAIIAAIEGRP